MPFLMVLILVSCKKDHKSNQQLEDDTIDPNALPTLQKSTFNGDSALIQTPYGYTPSKKYGLLLGFAAFGGQPNRDNLEELYGVAGKVRRQLTLDKNLIVICPQNNSGFFTPQEINNTINLAIQTYSVDTNRIYLTGLLRGGANVLNYLSDKPEYAKRIAAAVPMTSLTLDQQHIDHLDYAKQTAVIYYCDITNSNYNENKNYANAMGAEFIPFDRNEITYWKLYSPLTTWNNPTIYQRMLSHTRK